VRHECAAIAAGCGFPQCDAFIEKLSMDLTTQGSVLTSSMYRDFRKRCARQGRRDSGRSSGARTKTGFENTDSGSRVREVIRLPCEEPGKRIKLSETWPIASANLLFQHLPNTSCDHSRVVFDGEPHGANHPTGGAMLEAAVVLKYPAASSSRRRIKLRTNIFSPRFRRFSGARGSPTIDPLRSVIVRGFSLRVF
jgi:hypothetical protein